MKRNSLIFSFFVLGCLCFCRSAFSETIILKSGKSIKGKIVEETSRSIKIDYEGIVLTYWKDDIERIDKSKGQEAVVREQRDENEIKIKIKGTAENAQEFIDKVDLLGQNIQAIISNAQAEIAKAGSKNLTEKHWSILKKAVSDIKDKIGEIKKLNAPADCRELQKYSIEQGNAEIQQFTGEVESLSTVDELGKYWADYTQKLKTIREQYNKERQKVLDKVGSLSR
ncbi:MAG: hypothetical protein WC412_08035 [Candidatus Omnitrophota bacterium]|jgi:hypothetical protein